MTPPGRLVLLGHPVGHSLSPVFQNAALHHAGISARYDAVDVVSEEFDSTVELLKAGGGAGNVTVPYKARMYALCDRTTDVASRVRAVNTFWVDQGVLWGDNTDVAGFDHAVRSLITPKPGLRVAIVGAGGAAAAVVAAVEQWDGAQVAIWNRSRERADALVQQFDAGRTVTILADALREADLVVNATSVGLTDDQLPFDISHLRAGATVYDLVYRPGETALVHAARAAGHPAANGIGMLVEQGALAFKRWYDIEPDRDVMWQAVRSVTASPSRSSVGRAGA